jgi:hypothetical protein
MIFSANLASFLLNSGEIQMSEATLLTIAIDETDNGLRISASSPGAMQTEETTPFPPIQPGGADHASQALAGQLLYNAIFVGAIRELFVTLRQRAEAARVRIIIQIQCDQPGIADQPWELLHDGRWFLLKSGVEVIRYMDLPVLPSPVRTDLPLRTMLVAATPHDRIPLGTQAIVDIGFEQVTPPSYDQLVQHLESRRGDIPIFSFYGHGGFQHDQVGLFFEDNHGSTMFVSVDALGAILRESNIALAIICAFPASGISGATLFNTIAAALLTANLHCVVGVQGSLKPDDTRSFFRSLYEALGRQEPIAIALAHARKHLFVSMDWHKPVVYVRGSGHNGVGFVFPKAEPDQKRSAPDFEGVEWMVLHKAICDSYNVNNLRMLCRMLDVRFDNLEGATFEIKVDSLIQHQKERGAYATLVETLLKERPYLWDKLFDKA